MDHIMWVRSDPHPVEHWKQILSLDTPATRVNKRCPGAGVTSLLLGRLVFLLAGEGGPGGGGPHLLSTQYSSATSHKCPIWYNLRGDYFYWRWRRRLRDVKKVAQGHIIISGKMKSLMNSGVWPQSPWSFLNTWLLPWTAEEWLRAQGSEVLWKEGLEREVSLDLESASLGF